MALLSSKGNCFFNTGPTSPKVLCVRHTCFLEKSTQRAGKFSEKVNYKGSNFPVKNRLGRKFPAGTSCLIMYVLVVESGTFGQLDFT